MGNIPWIGLVRQRNLCRRRCQLSRGGLRERHDVRGVTLRGDAACTAAFKGSVDFKRAVFERVARFDGATVEGNVSFDEVQVLNLDDADLNKRRMWPDGYAVRPDRAGPTRGILVRVE
jgi:hypothetical protein